MATMNFKHFAEDIDSIIARDPAARSRLEVALTYPGFHAVVAHRLAHALYKRNWRVLARVVSQIARWFIVKDQRAFGSQLRRLAATPRLSRVIPGHGDVIDRDAPAVLERIAATLA